MLQIELRRRFAGRAIVILNLTNGAAGYLPPQSHYGRDQYSVWQTPFAAGALEQVLETASAGIERALEASTGVSASCR
jgi:hypothetical protein